LKIDIFKRLFGLKKIKRKNNNEQLKGNSFTNLDVRKNNRGHLIN